MKKVLIILLSIFFLIVTGMVLSYMVSQTKLKELNAKERAKLPGQFIKLPDGTISYTWNGPLDGEVLVLVHGFSTPKFVWDNNIKVLAEAGYRILTFDHFGRGFSDRPDVTYNKEHYIQEIDHLLTLLNIHDPVTLIGYSMGGGNVVGFAASHPQRIKQLILIAPVGYIPEHSGLAALVLVPGLGDWLFNLLGKNMILEELRKDVTQGKGTPDMVQNFERQFQYRGYLPALLSTLRHYPMYDLSEAYEKVGQLDIPTFAIWGTDDQTVPYAGLKKVKAAIPHSEHFTIKGGQHSMTYGEPGKINALLLKILKK